MARLQFGSTARDTACGIEVTSVVAQAVSWMCLREDLRAVLVINPEEFSSIQADGCADVWQPLPMPVVAVVRGTVQGYGLRIALDADVRFAALDTRLSFAGIDVQAVLRILGDRLSLRQLEAIRPFALSGGVLGPQQLLSAGLVSRLARDPLGLAEEAAREICRHDPVHVRNVKQLLRNSADMSYADCISAELDLHRKASRFRHG